MTGLEKIIEHIQLENKKACDEILSKANAQADEILKESENLAQKRYDEIIEKANADCDMLLQRSNSAAALSAKRNILLAKQQLVNECLQKALFAMKNMSDEEYFASLSVLIEKYSYDGQSGKLMLCEADCAKLPQGFLENINLKLAQKGASLVMCEEYGNFDKGFVLKYGDIEENCVFENLFDAYSDTLKDIAGSVLF